MVRCQGLGFYTESQFVRAIFFQQDHAHFPSFECRLISGVKADMIRA